jgi:hypothetical protein
VCSWLLSQILTVRQYCLANTGWGALLHVLNFVARDCTGRDLFVSLACGKIQQKRTVRDRWLPGSVFLWFGARIVLLSWLGRPWKEFALLAVWLVQLVLLNFFCFVTLGKHTFG